MSSSFSKFFCLVLFSSDQNVSFSRDLTLVQWMSFATNCDESLRILPYQILA